MLDKWEFIVGIFGAMIMASVVFTILKRKPVNQLPPGSIEIKELQSDLMKIIPGTTLSRYGILIGLAINSSMFFIALVIYWVDAWRQPSWFLIDLPAWINWIGICFIWVYYYEGVQIMRYNVNYRPLYKPLPAHYILSTGGPYHVIRHPMYVTKILSGVLLFLASGLWIQLIGVIIASVALPSKQKVKNR